MKPTIIFDKAEEKKKAADFNKTLENHVKQIAFEVLQPRFNKKILIEFYRGVFSLDYRIITQKKEKRFHLLPLCFFPYTEKYTLLEFWVRYVKEEGYNQDDKELAATMDVDIPTSVKKKIISCMESFVNTSDYVEKLYIYITDKPFFTLTGFKKLN